MFKFFFKFYVTRRNEWKYKKHLTKEVRKRSMQEMWDKQKQSKGVQMIKRENSEFENKLIERINSRT